MDAYKIGIVLAMNNGVSAVLGAISRDFAMTDQQATKLQQSLHKVKLLAEGGALAIGAGVVGLRFLGGLVKPATEYAHQIELMNAAGFKHQQIVEAIAAAHATSRTVATTTWAGNLATIRELTSVLKTTDEAVRNVAAVQSMDAVLTAFRGKSGRDETYKAAKTLELRGAANDADRFRSEAELMTAAIKTTGGTVAAGDFLQAMKMGGPVLQNVSTDFLYGVMPHLMQELGGSKTGTGLSAMYQLMSGATKLTATSQDEWKRFGLLGKDGHVQQRVFQAFAANPYEMIRTMLLPAMGKAGITDPVAIEQELSRLFQNKIAGRIAGTMATQGQQFDAYHRLYVQAQSGDNAQQLIQKDPKAGMQALVDQWTNFTTALGNTLIPIVVPALVKLIGVLQDMTAWAQQHQTLVKIILGVVAGLSGLAIVFGAVAVAAAGVAAIVAAPVAAAVAAIAAGLAAAGVAIVVFWKDIKAFVGPVASNYVKALSSFWGGIADAGKSFLALPIASIKAVLGGIGHIIGMEVAALKAAGDAIVAFWEKIKPMLGAVGGVVDSVAHGVGGVVHGVGDAVGGAAHTVGSWLGLTDATPPGGQAQPVQVTTQIHLDGRKVADVVTEHQAKAANRPYSGVTGFDGSRGVTYAPAAAR